VQSQDVKAAEEPASAAARPAAPAAAATATAPAAAAAKKASTPSKRTSQSAGTSSQGGAAGKAKAGKGAAADSRKRKKAVVETDSDVVSIRADELSVHSLQTVLLFQCLLLCSCLVRWGLVGAHYARATRDCAHDRSSCNPHSNQY
jgi:hypothetical protein